MRYIIVLRKQLQGTEQVEDTTVGYAETARLALFIRDALNNYEAHGDARYEALDSDMDIEINDSDHDPDPYSF